MYLIYTDKLDPKTRKHWEDTGLTWHESTLPCRNPAHIMLSVTAPLYTDVLLHSLESMIFTTAFCSIEGTATEKQKSTLTSHYYNWLDLKRKSSSTAVSCLFDLFGMIHAFWNAKKNDHYHFLKRLSYCLSVHNMFVSFSALVWFAYSRMRTPVIKA